MRNLYELSHAYHDLEMAIDEFAEENEGLVPDELEELLDQVTQDRAEKLENICKWRANLLAEAAMLKAEEKRLADRRKRAEKKAEALHKYIASCVGREEKLTCGSFTLSYRKSEALVVEDESQVDDEFFKVERKLDKALLKKFIKNGSLEQTDAVFLQTNFNLQVK